MRHVGFAGIIEIDLNGASAQHHVEAHSADARHMAQHDFVAAFGHDRQFRTGFVRPQAKPQKALAGFLANSLYLCEMATGFGASLVQIFERRARQFELACRFQTYRAIHPAHRDNFSVFQHGFPTELGQCHQQIADTAGFIIGWRVIIIAAIYELLMLCADTPTIFGFLTLGNCSDQLIAGFDHRIVAIRNCFCGHRGGLEM